MTATLLDVNLQQVPDPYLVGTWRVVERVLNKSTPDNLLAQATQLLLRPGELQLATPTATAVGSWAVKRDELLSRPYLQLDVDEMPMSALVTRLRRSLDGHYRTLALYFQSGLELLLEQP